MLRYHRVKKIIVLPRIHHREFISWIYQSINHKQITIRLKDNIKENVYNVKVHFHDVLFATKLNVTDSISRIFFAETKPNLSRPNSAVDKQVNIFFLARFRISHE